MTSSEILVVGAGPAGASTAFFLASRGLDVLVLDRAHFPRDKPCAEFLSPEASRLLAAMGALQTVERSGGAQLSGMRIRSPAGAWIHGDFVARHGYRGFRDRGLALRRTVLDTILLDRARAAGARVIEGERVTDLDTDAAGRVRGVRTMDEDGRRDVRRARLVIGADGLRSVVARRLGLTRTLGTARRLAVGTHYRGIEGVGDCGEMHVERDGYVGIANIGGGEANVAVVVPAARGREIAGDAAGFLERWVAARAHLAPRFARAARTQPVWATGPFASRARRAWSPGAALVGDAADFFDPFTGEGIYAALRGGEMLAPYAADAVLTSLSREADRALAAYDRTRRATWRGKWLVERLVGAAVARPVMFNRAARVLERRKDLADLLIGVAGDFVPASQVLTPGFLFSLFVASPPPAPQLSSHR